METRELMSLYAQRRALQGRLCIGEPDEHTRDRVYEGLEHIPKPVLERVFRAGVRIHILSDTETYASVSPTLSKFSMMELETKNGLFVLAEKRLYVRDTSPLTIVHEMGHAFDLALGDGAYLTDRLKPLFPINTGFVNRYSATDVHEWFAESFRAFCNVAEKPWETDFGREKLERVAPRLCAFFSDTIALRLDQNILLERYFPAHLIAPEVTNRGPALSF